MRAWVLLALAASACGKSSDDDPSSMTDGGHGGTAASSGGSGALPQGGSNGGNGTGGRNASGAPGTGGNRAGNGGDGNGGSAGSAVTSAGQAGDTTTDPGAGSGGEAGSPDDPTGGAAPSGGGNGTAGASGATSGGAAAAVAAAVRAFCGTARTCCRLDGVPALPVDCESKYEERQPALGLVATGQLAIDGEKLTECLAAYETAKNDCALDPVQRACSDVFAGMREPGDPCTNVLQCRRDEGPMNCNKKGSDTVGVCQRLVHGQMGQPCLTYCLNGDNCSQDTQGAATDEAPVLCFESDGLYCQYGDPVSRCEPLKNVGQTCDDLASCGSEAYCDTTCKPIVKFGEDCTSNTSCEDRLTCGEDQKCGYARFASDSTCEGYSPGP